MHSNKTRFPGLLRRDMVRRRKPMRYQIQSLAEKYPRKTMPSGTIYECRPDGWRWVGFKV